MYRKNEINMRRGRNERERDWEGKEKKWRSREDKEDKRGKNTREV